MKILLLVILLLTVVGITSMSPSSKKPKVLSERAAITPSVTPTLLLPSGKALKIAAFLVVRGTENDKKAYKKERGDEHMSDSELIKIVAQGYDSDPAKLAEKEALVQRIMAQEGQPDYYNTGYDESTLNNMKNKQNELEDKQHLLEREQDDRKPRMGICGNGLEYDSVYGCR